MNMSKTRSGRWCSNGEDDPWFPKNSRRRQHHRPTKQPEICHQAINDTGELVFTKYVASSPTWSYYSVIIVISGFSGEQWWARSVSTSIAAIEPRDFSNSATKPISFSIGDQVSQKCANRVGPDKYHSSTSLKNHSILKHDNFTWDSEINTGERYCGQARLGGS